MRTAYKPNLEEHFPDFYQNSSRVDVMQVHLNGIFPGQVDFLHYLLSGDVRIQWIFHINITISLLGRFSFNVYPV